MGKSRSKNASLNIIVGFATQVGLLLLSFIGRRIFVHYLSIDYLGINGLYGNILSVLSLAEFGLGNVTQFFLYKPVADGDTDKIRSLMHYFEKLYFGIALTVLGIGLALIPFLGYIVNAELPQNELIVYYVIFLLNSVASYYGASKVALLAANQDNRLQKVLTVTMNAVLQISYIFILIIWRNYIVYVSAMLVCTLMTQVMLSVICNKRYPYLKEKKKDVEIDKNYIIGNVKSTFVYKVGATIVNNTDNILISIIVNTATVGLYSNYYMVVSAIQGFLTIVTSSLISGIGNLSAEGNKKRMLEVFRSMLLFYHFVAAYGAISFFFLFRDLISVWIGTQYLMDNYTVFAIAFAFYVTNAISPIWMFREANGLFSKVKYLLLCTAGCNIVLSIALGIPWGTFGILIATSISRIITQVWYEPKVLFGALFNGEQKIYWVNQAKYLLLSVISFSLCYGLNSIVPHNVLFMVIKAALFLAISFAVFFVGIRRSPEFKEVSNKLGGMIRKIRKI